MTKEFAKLSLVSFEGVDDSGVVEQGADQIGAGLGLELEQLGLVGIGFKLKQVDGLDQAVAAVKWIHGATPPAASMLQRSQNSRCRSSVISGAMALASLGTRKASRKLMVKALRCSAVRAVINWTQVAFC